MKNKHDLRMAVIVTIAIFVSNIVAVFGIVWLAILLGILCASITNLCIGYNKDTSNKTKLIDYLSILIGSQFGWLALLV